MSMAVIAACMCPALETSAGHMLRLGSGYAALVVRDVSRTAVRINSETAAGCESAIE